MHEKGISSVQLLVRLELFICLWGLFSFACSSVSPVEQIGLYWAAAAELVLDRCVAFAPQGEMVLKKGCVSEKERGSADGWVTQCSNIPGQQCGAHCWLFACNNCSYISYSHISCFSGWMMLNLCVTSYLQWWCRSRRGWSKSHAMERFSVLNF